jgi:hypothetical protein
MKTNKFAKMLKNETENGKGEGEGRCREGGVDKEGEN